MEKAPGAFPIPVAKSDFSGIIIEKGDARAINEKKKQRN